MIKAEKPMFELGISCRCDVHHELVMRGFLRCLTRVHDDG